MKLKQVAANCTILALDNGNLVGFSYETPVAAEVDGVSYKTEQKFSVATSTHKNTLLKEMSGSYGGTKPQSFFDGLLV